MATITRQQFTDAVDPAELRGGPVRAFAELNAWLWSAIATNDLIEPTPALRAQVAEMFKQWPKTRANYESLLGA